VEDAIHFAQSASDLELAARLIEQHGLAFLLQARVRTVESWLSALPEPGVADRPGLLMVRAWLRLFSGTAPEAEEDLARLAVYFNATPPASLDPGLHGEWLTLCARMQSAQGRARESRDLAEEALRRLPDAASAIRTLAAVTLATAHATLLDYDRAAEIFERIVREARSRDDFATEILSTSGQAQMMLLQGRLGAAYRIAAAGIERLEHSGRSTPFSATLYGELAQVHFDRHELDLARVYLRRSREASGASGYRDSEMYEHVALSRMCGMHGDREGAARECDRAAALMRQFPPVMVREEILAQQVRVALAAGLIRDAQRLLEAEGFTLMGAPERPELVAGAPVTHAVGLLYNSVLRVWLATARASTEPIDLTEILQWAERVLAGELICRHVPVALETLLLMAQLHAAAGAPADGLARVEQALALAQPEGFISVFLEAGRPIAALLTRVADRRLCPEPLQAHARTILAAASSGPAAISAVSPGAARPDRPVLIEALTERERAVLERIAAGDTNQDIANRLVISVSAVKKHTVNLYGKLGVHTRTQAVACARDLGLLAAT
jgi:LuxR family maltose regulon positive regulatory protein